MDLQLFNSAYMSRALSIVRTIISPCLISLPVIHEKSRFQVVIGDSRERLREMQKNSWRSFDSCGNGYLNVYEGGAPSSHRIWGRAYMYISPRYINRPEGGSRGGGQASMWKVPERMARQVPPPLSLPLEKGATGRRGISALSQRIYSLPSLLKPKYNGQVKCNSFPRSLHAPYWGNHVESRQVETPCISGWCRKWKYRYFGTSVVYIHSVPKILQLLIEHIFIWRFCS